MSELAQQVFSLATVIGVPIAIALGAWLKSRPEVNNRVIPWVVAIITTLTQLADALTQGSAHAADGSVPASSAWLARIGAGLLVGVFAVGVYSFYKNAIRGKVSGSRVVVGIGLVAMIGALLAGNVCAKPLADVSRLSIGAGASGVIYEQRATHLQTSAYRVHGYASYTGTDRLSLAGVVNYDPAWEAMKVTAGLRMAVVGNQPSDRLQGGIGLDAVWYSGHGYANVARSPSYQVVLPVSWSVIQTVAHRDVVWAFVQGAYDPDIGDADVDGKPGGRYEVSLGLRTQLFGGK